MNSEVEVRVLGDGELRNSISALCRLLIDCVRDGASLGFMLDLDHEGADKYWNTVAQRSESGALVVLGAFVGDDLAGTVTLVFSSMPNQQHKAEVSKLLVSPSFRRHGIATVLMQTVEALASEFDREILVLDTLTGTAAEIFYEKTGWQKVGEIPRFAQLPEGGDPLPTSLFYKDLRK
jgi:ribosomal protein S18 acetylase RimI-like enzyme